MRAVSVVARMKIEVPLRVEGGLMIPLRRHLADTAVHARLRGKGGGERKADERNAEHG